MLHVGGDDLVVFTELEPRKDDVAGIGRRADERDALRRGLQHPGERAARLLAEIQNGFEVRLTAAAELEVAAVPLVDRGDGLPRQRPVRARVEVRESPEARELPP